MATTPTPNPHRNRADLCEKSDNRRRSTSPRRGPCTHCGTILPVRVRVPPLDRRAATAADGLRAKRPGRRRQASQDDDPRGTDIDASANRLPPTSANADCAEVDGAQTARRCVGRSGSSLAKISGHSLKFRSTSNYCRLIKRYHHPLFDPTAKLVILSLAWIPRESSL